MRNLLVAEVVTEPRNTLFQSQSIQRFVTYGSSACAFDRFAKHIPESRQIFSRRKKFRTRNATGRPPGQSARNASHSGLLERQFLEITEIDRRQLLRNFRCIRSFERHGAK